ncbi:tetratricopeptide repeat protein, partial [Thermodesulfobacteriota bacterium]
NVILGKLPPAVLYFRKGIDYLNRKDPAEAAHWFKKAADQGNRAGYFQLGRLYENGWGVPKNERKAEEYYRKFGDYVKAYQKGARQGVKEAQEWLTKRGLKW